MRKLDSRKQMNALLLKNKVTASDIHNLAQKIASFHQETEIIHNSDFLDLQQKFNDLSAEQDYLREHLSMESSAIIGRAIGISDAFIERNKALLAARSNAGFFRDGHGDLHSRNIFLLPAPQVFDCIEFNDNFRRIDILNEVAFLCMDLDAFGRPDLSDLFLNCYNHLFPSMRTEEDRRVFIYYKSYRSNIRAKVNSLRARDVKNEAQRILILSEADKYLRLMEHYLNQLETNYVEYKT
jgi:aminoglycoside phosphotransferase family enzyme